ncbi:SmpA/OmlA domain-containing protein [Pseudomonas putida S11]|nr:SmpA/OmlA domain-containing protein [Pseudomonas putida S11]
MGNPLIQDTFNTNRWDYLYSLQPGGGKRQQERMSVFFNESDQLVSLSGDFMPGVSRDQEILGGSSDTTVSPANQPEQPTVQPEEKPAKPGSVEESIQREIDTIETTPVPTPAPLETLASISGEQIQKSPDLVRAFCCRCFSQAFSCLARWQNASTSVFAAWLNSGPKVARTSGPA